MKTLEYVRKSVILLGSVALIVTAQVSTAEKDSLIVTAQVSTVEKDSLIVTAQVSTVEKKKTHRLGRTAVKKKKTHRRIIVPAGKRYVLMKNRKVVDFFKPGTTMTLDAVNCLKIKCPGTFGPKWVCWECR